MEAVAPGRAEIRNTKQTLNPNVQMTETKAANDIVQAAILFGSLEF
jgi:hypothetical protein